MKIEIPLQFFLVCLLILGVSVFLGALYFQKTEAFQDIKLGTDDFDIQIQACPSGTSSYNNKGDILCCDGSIVNEMCNGRTVCSVSDEKPNMTSCVNLVRKDLNEKARKFCPPTLPKYFEDPAKKISGCTRGDRTTDGKSPKSTSQPKCTIYTSYEDNKNKLDSCDNIKQRDLFTCPMGKQPTLVSIRADKPALVSCSFTSNTDPQPLTCYSDQSLTDFYLAFYGSDWKTNMTRDTKLTFCSTAQKYFIDRAISEEELELIPGPYSPVGKVANCIFNARMYANKYPDLKRAFGYNEVKLRNHYVNHGIKEGREYKTGCRFDARTYANLNPDVKRVYKDNITAITNHYKLNGIKENRIFNKV
jgi:hypothetical protein